MLDHIQVFLNDMRLMRRWLSIATVFWLGISPLYSQVPSNQRSQKVGLETDNVTFDTLSIIPNSVKIYDAGSNHLLDSSQYIIHYPEARLEWLNPSPPDSILIEYKVFPFYLSQSYFDKPDSIINMTPEIIINPFEVKPDNTYGSIVDFGGLDYNGSFARGISFGNNQDVVLNSSFNLQLAGTIAGDVEVLAAMTDNNVPIQPEGNTQQIQDFDKVFIQLKRKNSQLTVGDFDIRNPEGYFVRYNKKLQGGKFKTLFELSGKKKTTVILEGGVAVSRGQYARNQFMGNEGNQGPYRLVGNNGETFLVVIAGTERVYIDGALLKRGAENDYVIDYNSGEIIFMPGRLITKDSRITIEFEYSVQNYFRSLYQVNNAWTNDKMSVRFALVSEQDNKNQPILQTLDSAQRRLLSDVGDSLFQAFYPGWEEVEFTTDQILYEMKDTTANSILYPDIFLYSTDPAKANYKVRFTFVGQGNGNYSISNSGINGRIYDWVAPENGIPQGSYAPFIKLVAPEKKQIASLGFNYKLSNTSTIETEASYSYTDINTFSEKGNNDNGGMALLIRSKNKILQSKSGKSWFQADASYEFTAKQFNPINAYRAIEFTRDWNTELINQSEIEEHLAIGSISYIHSQKGQMGYVVSLLNMPGQYNGNKHSIQANMNFGTLKILTNSSYLQSSSQNESTVFIRPNLDISNAFKGLKGFRVGFRMMVENNESVLKSNDSISPLSFAFTEIGGYIQAADSAKRPFSVNFLQRDDLLPSGNELKLFTRAQNLEVDGGFTKNPKSQLRYNFKYRKLDIIRAPNSQKLPEQSILGRITYNLIAWKGFIRSSTLYEAGSGQELKKEFSFLQVPEGQGTHVWNDDGDGIQQLDEFDIASETDAIFANFIRLVSPTNEFVPTNITQFNQILDINPGAGWKGKKGLQGFLSKWANVTSVRFNRKILSDGKSLQINPFDINVADTSLIAISSIFRNTLFLNRYGSKFGLEFNFQDSRNKQLLTLGPESRNNNTLGLKLKWILSKKFNFSLNTVKGYQASSSEAFISRNYRYDFVTVEPELLYQSGRKFRINIKYSYSGKGNEPELGGETATIHQISFDSRYNVVSKSSITFRFSFAGIDFEGDDTTPLAYNMLNGLRDGNNFLWNLTFERRLAKFIQLSLSYDGKQAGQNKVVHLGRAQIRAIF